MSHVVRFSRQVILHIAPHLFPRLTAVDELFKIPRWLIYQGGGIIVCTSVCRQWGVERHDLNNHIEK